MKDLKNYKALSKKDMKNKKWKFAPILVSTNRERLDITELQAVNFAKENKTYVVRWRIEYKDWEEQPKNWEKIMSEDPVFWQYWVKNAEGYILTNFNTDAKIANGTSFHCHSLVFDKSDKN